MDEEADQATRVFRLQRKSKGIAPGTELHGFAISSFDEYLGLGAGIVHDHHAAHLAAVVRSDRNSLDNLCRFFRAADKRRAGYRRQCQSTDRRHQYFSPQPSASGVKSAKLISLPPLAFWKASAASFVAKGAREGPITALTLEP